MNWMNSNFGLSLAVVLVTGFQALSARATLIVDDHFNNGTLGTNPTGVGTGFNSQYVAPVEAGSTVTLVGGTGYNNTGIISKDSAGIFDGDGGFVTFVLASSAGSQTQAQIGLGDAAYSSYSDFMQSTTQTFGKPVGFALAMGGVNGFNTSQWTIHADSAQYRISDGYPSYSYATVLSQFNSTWDGNSPLTITMKLSLSGWEVNFSNGMATQQGLWSSVTWPTAVGGAGYTPLKTVLDIPNMRAKARVQGDQFATRTLVIDQIIVNDHIPEPATLLLFGLGSWLLFARRRG